MVRWYVLQVTTGQETGVRDALQTLGIRAAVPREERAIRSGGGWTTKVYTLLPGYVFLALEYSAENYYRVKAIPHVLRFLGSNGLSPSYLTHLEVEWLRLLDNGGAAETLQGGGTSGGRYSDRGRCAAALPCQTHRLRQARPPRQGGDQSMWGVKDNHSLHGRRRGREFLNGVYKKPDKAGG